MKDLHSHYLPGVDDGSKNIEMTLKMLENAKKVGITDIVFTPHYVLESEFMSSYQENKNIFNNIVGYASDLDINIYLGNEVYCPDDLVELYKTGNIATINNSKYMLIEIPMHTRVNNLKSIFFELINYGITPILAHPERYTAYHDEIDFFYELRSMGVLLQLNLLSLIGLYGKKEKKMAKKLLKNNLYSFIGSDIHSANIERYMEIPKALKKLKKYVGEDKYLELTEENFEKVVNNVEI